MARFAGGPDLSSGIRARATAPQPSAGGAADTFGRDGGGGSPEAVAAYPAAVPGQGPDGPGGARLVLVAEDEDGSRLAICEILRDGGYRALGARDGLELVQLASTQRPAVILMDLAMPTLNGMEAVSALRSASQTAGIRVIAITASWLGERSDLLAAAGFDGALRKPCTAAELLEEIDRVLSQDAVAQQAAD